MQHDEWNAWKTKDVLAPTKKHWVTMEKWRNWKDNIKYPKIKLIKRLKHKEDPENVIRKTTCFSLNYKMLTNGRNIANKDKIAKSRVSGMFGGFISESSDETFCWANNIYIKKIYQHLVQQKRWCCRRKGERMMVKMAVIQLMITDILWSWLR